MAKTQFDTEPKVIRSDNGEEYTGKRVRLLLKRNETLGQFTAPYTRCQITGQLPANGWHVEDNQQHDGTINPNAGESDDDDERGDPENNEEMPDDVGEVCNPANQKVKSKKTTRKGRAHRWFIDSGGAKDFQGGNILSRKNPVEKGN